MADCCGADARDKIQRQLLWVVLALNAGMFIVEFIAGWIAESSGLLADSLDMLADSLVYAVSLYAVGRGLAQKAKAALFNGVLQMVLGLFVLAHVGWRALEGSPPSAEIMGWMGLLALIVNFICFLLLLKFRRGDVNMRASWICSRNDIFANVGIIVAAGMVAWAGSPWPDLIIATLIAGIVIQSSGRVIADARHSLRTGEDPNCDTR